MNRNGTRSRICLALLLAVLLAACHTHPPDSSAPPDFDPSVPPPEPSALPWPDTPAPASEFLAHDPYGHNNLYGAKEVPAIWWSRSPRDPQEGEPVSIVVSVLGGERDVFVEWRINGELQPQISCRHAKNINEGGTTKRQYEGIIGPFTQGDRVEYRIHADGERIGPFSFTVTKWETGDSVSEIRDGVFTCVTASLETTLSVTSPRDGTICLSVNKRPPENGKPAGKNTLTDIGVREIRLLTDGETVHGIELKIHAPEHHGFYGFGMRYDSLNQRGKDVDIYCVNWYTDQVRETYTPVPYYFVPDTYGLFVDSTAYSRFRLGTRESDICSVEVYDSDADFYFFTGGNAAIADGYTSVAGKPVLPPVWAFGPWISANEWDRQSKVMEQLEQTAKHDIPTSVMVLEAWSDEDTFYRFNDAIHTPSEGNWIPRLSDFTFTGRWPDPKGMTDAIHGAGIKLLLWQIPVLRDSPSSIQSSRDQSYAQTEGYVIRNGDGSPYRMPRNTWFGGSLLVDFTHPAASRWFLDKRRYLLEELGIDGFKTDGGEFVWGRDTAAYDGRGGITLRNAYPDIYAQAYFDYARQIIPDALTFSRAGGAAMQKHPICWAGDQRSTADAFQDAIRATLSASMSGIPFVAWDIAGFSGDIPGTELYQRSVAQAAFSPIMQIHSEANSSGTPPSQARTPWNMAERKGNDTCLETYRYYANLRMNLMPYIYSEARYSSLTGEPMMRGMAYAFPGDAAAAEYEFQYMFGRSLLVAPVTNVSRTHIEVYLPEGRWYDFFTGQEYQAGRVQIECRKDEIPVFVKAGSIIPLNLDASRNLGESIGNNVERYNHLTFRVFPGDGTTVWYDYAGNTEVTVAVSGGSVTVRNLSHDYSLEFMDQRLDSYQVLDSGAFIRAYPVNADSISPVLSVIHFTAA